MSIEITEDEKRTLWNTPTFMEVYFKNAKKGKATEVFHAVDALHLELFRKHKYTDYQSFRQMRYRYLKALTNAA